jgi:hypothetical protein
MMIIILINEYEDIIVLWNQEVQMDTEVLTNRPDDCLKTRTEPGY